MTEHFLDPRLKEDTYLLGRMGCSRLLLHRNAHFPWFILVPDTDEIELYKLERWQQGEILDQINAMSEFMEGNFGIDKLNVAQIGNIVAQMHIHIVGRRKSDPCWPGVVWSCQYFVAYQPEEVKVLQNQLKSVLGERLITD